MNVRLPDLRGVVRDLVRCALKSGLLSYATLAAAGVAPETLPLPPVTARAHAGLHDVAAIRRYLASTHGVGPALRAECGGAPALTALHVRYARLLGTAAEQALVEATTCMMGNGGADIVLVLGLDAHGRIKELPIDDGPRAAAELYAGQRRTPRLETRDGKLLRWFVKEDAADGKIALRREITYRWADGRFVVDDVRDIAEPRR